MGLNLLDYLRYQTNQIASAENKNVDADVSAQNLSEKAILELLMSKSGQTVAGEVVSVDGNNVRIRLNQNTVINALMQQNMMLETGKTILFEIGNVQNGQISIRPLYANTLQNPNILKALEQAELPATDRNVMVVEEMMHQGLSVSKQSLQNTVKLANQFMESDVKDIVDLSRLNIPVTKDNLEKYVNFNANNRELTNDMMQLTDSLSSTIGSLNSEGNYDAAVKVFFLSMTELLSTGESASLNANTVGGSVSGDVTAGINSGVVGNGAEGMNTPPASNVPAGVTDTASNVIVGMNADNNGSVVIDTAISENMSALNSGQALTGQIQAGEISASANQAAISDREAELSEVVDKRTLVGSGSVSDRTSANGLSALTLSVREDRSSFAEAASKSGISEMPWYQDFMSAINSTDSAERLAGQIMKLLRNHDVKEGIISSVMNKWLLKPEDVTGKNLSEVYHSVKATVALLQSELAPYLSADTSFMRGLDQLAGKQDFLQNLSQMFQYVQIPLKMSESNVTGQLHVYSGNKRSSADSENGVSALLHLNMEHLGGMDVLIHMKSDKVTTHFTLEREDTLQLIADHIDMLDKRLARKGYHLKSEFGIAEKQLDMVENLKNETSGFQVSEQREIVKYSFDVRA